MRDDFTYSFSAKGRHDLRTGGEFLLRDVIVINRRQNMGQIDAARGQRPAFPRRRSSRRGSRTRGTSTPGTWRRSRPLVRSYTIGVGDFAVDPNKKFAFWAQDDWQIMDRLTLNLGVRYDAGRHLCQRHQLPAVPGGRSS